MKHTVWLNSTAWVERERLFYSVIPAQSTLLLLRLTLILVPIAKRRGREKGGYVQHGCTSMPARSRYRRKYLTHIPCSSRYRYENVCMQFVSSSFHYFVFSLYKMFQMENKPPLSLQSSLLSLLIYLY